MINGRYSLLQYSANTGVEVEVADSFLEELKAVAGSAVFVDVSDGFDESATCIARVTASVITVASISESVHSDTRMVANVDTVCVCHSVLSASVVGAQDIYESRLFSSDVAGISYMSTNIPEQGYWYSTVEASASIVKNITDTGLFATEIVFATVAAITIEENVLTVSVSIPPGGELRIDSDRFTVTLNGENILHLQSGYWPKLSRDLVQMTVDSGSGGVLSGEIVYAERWL